MDWRVYSSNAINLVYSHKRFSAQKILNASSNLLKNVSQSAVHLRCYSYNYLLQVGIKTMLNLFYVTWNKGTQSSHPWPDKSLALGIRNHLNRCSEIFSTLYRTGFLNLTLNFFFATATCPRPKFFFVLKHVSLKIILNYFRLFNSVIKVSGNLFFLTRNVWNRSHDSHYYSSTSRYILRKYFCKIGNNL